METSHPPTDSLFQVKPFKCGSPTSIHESAHLDFQLIMLLVHSPTMQYAYKLSDRLIFLRPTAIAQAVSRKNQRLTTISMSEKT
jgi:hypothetical protein